MADITLADLLQRRDAVDERFLYYSDRALIAGNTQALAQMALIGGRLDTMIRRERAAERARKRWAEV